MQKHSGLLVLLHDLPGFLDLRLQGDAEFCSVLEVLVHLFIAVDDGRSDFAVNLIQNNAERHVRCFLIVQLRRGSVLKGFILTLKDVLEIPVIR